MAERPGQTILILPYKFMAVNYTCIGVFHNNYPDFYIK